MKKRIVVVTSTSCVDTYNHNEDIRVVRIVLTMDGKDYRDGLDIKPEEFFPYINENKHILPKTTQPSLGSLMEFFEGLADEGYEEAIVYSISSCLSGTYNGIRQVAEMLEDKITIIPFDTKTVCFNEGLFALRAAEMVRNGVPTKEIIAASEKMKVNNTIFFAVDSLEYLVKNGRLSGAAGFVGKHLKIKPILQVQETGKIESIEKIRTLKKSLETISSYVEEYIAGRKYYAYILYTGLNGLHHHLTNSLKENCGIENLELIPCSPVVGCHVGGEVVGVGIVIEE